MTAIKEEIPVDGYENQYYRHYDSSNNNPFATST